MKPSSVVFLFLTASALLCAMPDGASGQAVRKVVIDAGHGGSDPGANYAGCREKDITLRVALSVGEQIKRRFPDVTVVYTRDTDKAVALVDRSRKSNDAGADLFISIHVNAATSPSPCGYETYVMGPGKTKQNMDVAMRENSVITYEDDYQRVYDGFDPSSAESYILFSLMQDAYFERSLRFSQILQEQYAVRMPSSSVNRGVKQAGFLVLWRTATPSVLTEIGFLSNETERKYMMSEAGCRNIALSITEAFAAYKREMDAVYGAEHPAAPVKRSEGPAVASSAGTGAVSAGAGAASAGKSSSSGGAVSASGAGRPSYRNVRFKIQIKSAVSPIKRNASELGCYASSAEERMIDGRYKYFVGNVKSYQEALSLQTEVRARGFGDAFIVPFASGSVIPIADARAAAP